MALRLAMNVGLHRDPKHFTALFSLGKQLRRRLWYRVLELMPQAIFNLSAPLFVGHDSYDTELPTDSSDRDLSGVSSEINLPNPFSSLRVRVEAAAGLTAITQQSDYKAVIDLGKQLKEALSRLLGEAQTRTRSNSSGEAVKSSQVLQFHVPYLEMTFHHYILMIHRPVVLLARRDLFLYYARKTCYESAIALAHLAYRLRLPDEPSDDLKRFLAVAKGLTNIPLSLDTITMLGLELMTQVEEGNATPTRAHDTARQLAKASREQSYAVLEPILAQHHGILARGSVGMKRYGYLTCILAQLRAMEEGADVPQAVVARLQEAVKIKRPLLEATVAKLRALAQSGHGHTNSFDVDATQSDPDLLHDLDGLDFDLGLDEFFHFPEMTGSISEW